MGYIYKITNVINNKVYIGQTHYTIQKRWIEHCSAFNKLDYPLYRAMRKYGQDNFIIEEIEQVPDELLNEHEIYWIGFYHSYAPLGCGYNVTLGGEGNRLYEQKQICDLWDTGMCITEISEQTGADRHVITDILKDYQNYSTEESEKRGHKLLWTKRGRQVNQYDLKGNYITTFDTLMDAERKTGISQKNIFTVVSHKSYTAGGFQWKYIDDPFEIKDVSKKTKKQKRPVIQFKNNEEVEYESAAEAERQTGISAISIRRVCQEKGNTAGGFKWKYKE